MSDLKEKDSKDLKALLSEKREAVRASRFGFAGSSARNVKMQRTTRREIAQILTELRKRNG